MVLPLQDIHIKMLIPVALLEAMARGTICFVSDLPNLKLLVNDEQNAVIFQRDNILDLKNKIIRYIVNSSIGKSAHLFGKNFIDYPTIAQKYFYLFQAL